MDDEVTNQESDQQMMEIQVAGRRYSWDSNWAKVPANIKLGYTHGVVVDSVGCVHVFNQSRHAVLTFDPNGDFVGTWPEFPNDRFLGAHGMTLVGSDGGDAVWLTDQNSGEVVKASLQGETILSVAKPDHPAYRDGGKYSPTWAAECPDDGMIYVADGYGASLIHRYDSSGGYVDTFDGSSGIGAFRCPHGIAFMRRPEAVGTDDWVLYITDRGNARIQVYDRNLNFITAWYQDAPCCFAEGADGELVIPDLRAFINIYDRRDLPIITRLGDNQHPIVQHHNWPNVPHEMREDGLFNSPHGAAVADNGDIYVVEWVEDGRITKLGRLE